jgi:hypothetical protein
MDVMTKIDRHRRAWIAAFAATGTALAIAACSDMTGTGERNASVSFHVTKGLGASNNLALSPSAVEVTGDGHTLDLQTVDVTFDHVSFLRKDNHSESDDDSDDDSDGSGTGGFRFRIGATTVSLALDGGVTTAFAGELPFGSYDRLDMKAEYIHITGTYDGEPVDVTIPVHAKLKLSLIPPLVVDAINPAPNVTVNINVLDWFKTAGGSVVDPRDLPDDNKLRAAFIRRIRSDFRAFEDHDHDGDESDSDSDSDSEHNGDSEDDE